MRLVNMPACGRRRRAYRRHQPCRIAFNSIYYRQRRRLLEPPRHLQFQVFMAQLRPRVCHRRPLRPVTLSRVSVGFLSATRLALTLPRNYPSCIQSCHSRWGSKRPVISSSSTSIIRFSRTCRSALSMRERATALHSRAATRLPRQALVCRTCTDRPRPPAHRSDWPVMWAAPVSAPM